MPRSKRRDLCTTIVRTFTSDYQSTAMKLCTFVLPAISLSLLLCTPMMVKARNSDSARPAVDRYEPSFARLRDTLYLLDTTYLEIRLDQQMIYQHFRSGRVERYPCSTGNPRIKDGIATRQGIFTIGGKAKRTLSQQFQVYLNYWMQFDGGIGLHGLDSRSYYRHLGKRSSSHGCIRISNETGSKLFSSVRSGTIVYVHGGSPARVLVFADSSLPGLQSIYDIDRALVNSRVEAVRRGRWYDSSLHTRIAIPARARLPYPVSVGTVDPDMIVRVPIRLAPIPVVTRVQTHTIVPARPLPSDSGSRDGILLSSRAGSSED